MAKYYTFSISVRVDDNEALLRAAGRSMIALGAYEPDDKALRELTTAEAIDWLMQPDVLLLMQPDVMLPGCSLGDRDCAAAHTVSG